MSSEAYLALLLDAPLQSWGSSSRFQRRTTGLYPTKSGVVGLVCAAMGLAKGQEGAMLDRLANLRMTTVILPRYRPGRRAQRPGHLPIRRLEDFHTVGAGYDPETQEQFIPRKAAGGPSDNPTVTYRQYLLDARFGVILGGESSLLDQVAAALRNPVWGIWFGRKCCIPATPVLASADGSQSTVEEAWRSLVRAARLPDSARIEQFERIEETTPLAAHESLLDHPVSFGDGTSSGPDKREFAVRWIARRTSERPW
jgi:CRISPR system Cascade subunit CasD